MARRVMVTTLLVCGMVAGAFGQAGTSARPPLFLGESWKGLDTPPDDHGAWPASQAGVASPSLRLTLLGTSGKEIQLVGVRGTSDLYPVNLWTGTTTSPSGASLRDRDNMVDLSDPLAKIRWVVRTSGFHQVRPILRLADGTWLVGDHTTGPTSDFSQDDVTIADVRWMQLDAERMVAVGNWVDHPDLSRVDEVGFADLMPGSGHGPGGYVNVGRIEVYGRPVRR